MKWEREQWRKLYTRVTAEWLSLPVSARGLGSELLKYADDDGSIYIGTEPPGQAVAFLLGARPAEHERIAEDTWSLIRIGFMAHDGERIQIRNFAKAQERHGSAKRMAAKRTREKSDVTHASRRASRVTSHKPSHGAEEVTSPNASLVTSQSDGSRSRSEEDSPLPPKGVPAGGAGPVADEHSRIRVAFAEGAGSAAGRLITPPQKLDEERALNAIRETHGAGKSLDEFCAWLRAEAEAWVREVRANGEERYSRGFAPSKFAEWLNTKPAATVEPEEPRVKFFEPKPFEGAVPAPPEVLARFAEIGRMPARRSH